MRRRTIRLFTALSVLLAAPFAVHAQGNGCALPDGTATVAEYPCGKGPLVETGTQYYDIAGRTIEEIEAQIRSKGPAGWAGVTHSDVRYEFQTRRDAGLCRIDSVHAAFRGKVELPRWTEERAATGELRGWWKHYMVTLRQHEDGHVRIGIETAAEVEQALLATAAAPSCEQVKAEAERRAHAVLRQLEPRQQLWDQTTDHGRRG